MSKLRFHVPDFDELWYKQQLISEYTPTDKMKNPLPLTDNALEQWYSYWTKSAPSRYYAYIVSNDDYIGEAMLERTSDDYDDCYAMNIFLQSSNRGQGFGSTAVQLLLDIAFNELGASTVHCTIESYNSPALYALLHSGLHIISQANHLVQLCITAFEYNS